MEAVIFDMDGVLTDSEALHIYVEKEVCKKYGIKIKGEWWKRFTGRRSVDIFQMIIDFSNTKGVTAEQMAQDKLGLYTSLAKEKMELFDGVMDLLKYLSTKYKLGLCTSSTSRIQQQVFEKFKLDDFFKAVVTGDIVKEGKPSPEGYELAMRKLNIPADQTIIIEDADNGIAAAKAAGATVIAITNTMPKERLAEADFVVDDYGAIMEIFETF